MKEKGATLSEIDETLEVIKPIPIVIKDYGNEVFADFIEAEAYGAGLTEAEAVSNLKADIKSLFLDLEKSDDSKLGKLPLGWKKILLETIKRKGD